MRFPWSRRRAATSEPVAPPSATPEPSRLAPYRILLSLKPTVPTAAIAGQLKTALRGIRSHDVSLTAIEPVEARLRKSHDVVLSIAATPAAKLAVDRNLARS
ncbi:MAG: hypothetical protein H7146_14805, partial [Burkholderiaceae bacterium]|nr:hypothetical protein [Microbacteriaceae bacterium]